MKSYSLAFLISTCAVAADAPSRPTFSEKLDDLPVLSLSEAARAGRMHLVDGETRSTGGSFRSAAAREKKYISRMPVIVPREGIDQNMLIKAPDSSIDFKMIVKDPSVEDVK